MTIFRLGGYALCICAAAAILGGCDAAQVGAPGTTASATKLRSPADLDKAGGAPAEVKGGCEYYVPVGKSSRGEEYGFLQRGVIHAASIPTPGGVKYDCMYYSKIGTPTYEYKLDANESISALKNPSNWSQGNGEFSCNDRTECFFTISKASGL